MNTRLSIIAAVGAASLATALTVGSQVSASSIKVSFASDSTSSAGWFGPHHAGIHLTIGDGPSSSVYAAANLRDLPSTSLDGAQDPTFTTDNYNAGSPRWNIFLSSGAYLFGYPPNSGLNGGDFAWSVNACGSVSPNTYMSFAEAVSTVDAYCSGSITGVQIIADGDQSAATTDTITGVQYGGQPLTNP